MVRLKVLLFALVAILATPNINAAWRVVIDRNAVQAVSANLASQKMIESKHNERLDSMAERQKKIELYTVSMATIKELYKQSMENVTGFGPESKYYKEIASCATDIVFDVPKLIKTVNGAKFSNKLMCLTELSNLVIQTRQLVADFVNIVNNAEVRNPLKLSSPSKSESDGYNLLNRYERLTLANRIYTDLMQIRYKVDGMMMMAHYATLNDLFFSVDPEGWANIMAAKNNVNGLIMSWNGFFNIKNEGFEKEDI